jgi:hypothetical protein
LRRFFSRNKDKEEGGEENPFTKPSPPKPKVKDPMSFTSYLKGGVHDFDRRVSSDRGWLGRKKIHIRVLRQTKRAAAAFLFFLYLLLGFVSVPNPMSLLFFFTGFLMLDYLWKSRKVEWKKQE